MQRLTMIFLILILIACCSNYQRQAETVEAQASQLTLPAWQSLDFTSRAQVSGASSDGIRFGHNRAQVEYFLTLIEQHIGEQLQLPFELLKAAHSASPQKIEANTSILSFRATSKGRELSTNMRHSQALEKLYSSIKITSLPLSDNGCCLEFELARCEAKSATKGIWEIFDLQRIQSMNKTLTVSYDITDPKHQILNIKVNSTGNNRNRLGPDTLITEERTPEQIRRSVYDNADAGSRIFTWQLPSFAGSYIAPDGRKACWGPAEHNFPDLECEDQSLENTATSTDAQ